MSGPPGVEDKAWTDDVLRRGAAIQEKAIALEREILEVVKGRIEA